MSIKAYRYLVRSIRIGIRSRLLLCLITIASAYSIYLINNPLVKLLSIFAFIVASEMMIILWGNFFVDNLTQTYNCKKRISWEETPLFRKFSKIAGENGIKLHSKKPFGVRQNFDNAYANPITRQIIFGDILLKRLKEKEKIALLGHELTHLKENHYIKTLIWTLVIPTLVIIPLTFIDSPSVVRNIVFCAAFFMTFLFISWNNEYSADVGGATISSPNAMYSLLRKLIPKRQWRRESETHPSISGRLLKIKKIQSIG